MFPVWTTEQVVTFFVLRREGDKATSGHAESIAAARLPAGMSRRQRELRQEGNRELGCLGPSRSWQRLGKTDTNPSTVQGRGVFTNGVYESSPPRGRVDAPGCQELIPLKNKGP